MLRAIVFDFDGVLVDTERLHHRAFLSVLEPLGVRFDFERYLQYYVGLDDRNGFRAICIEHCVKLDETQLRKLIRAKARAFEQILDAGVQPLPGALELVEEARATLPLAIVSGSGRGDIALILAHLGGTLESAFATIVSTEDVLRSKPDPAGYTLAVERLGVAPASALAVEDTPCGLQSAAGAGLRTLGVATTHPVDRLAGAERVVKSMEAVNLAQLHAWYGEDGEAPSSCPVSRGDA